MKEMVWDDAKNRRLQRERGVSFEMAAAEIAAGRIQAAYVNKRGQVCYVISLKGYPHVVPTVENDVEIVLKTIWPDRRHK
jgi:hypothetical protein